MNLRRAMMLLLLLLALLVLMLLWWSVTPSVRERILWDGRDTFIY